MYGYCPTCRAPGKARERRPDGDDICENGHKYPSKSAIPALSLNFSKELQKLFVHTLPLMTEQGGKLFQSRLNEAICRVVVLTFSPEELEQFRVTRMVE